MKSKILFISLLFLLPAAVSAGEDHNMSGYAWSSNIGWISFNCTNDDTCSTVNYGVHKDEDGTIVGYAWSSNIGWIRFGGLSGLSLIHILTLPTILLV